MIKTNNPHILNIGMEIYCMSKKLPVTNFKWVEDISEAS